MLSLGSEAKSETEHQQEQQKQENDKLAAPAFLVSSIRQIYKRKLGHTRRRSSGKETWSQSLETLKRQSDVKSLHSVVDGLASTMSDSLTDSNSATMLPSLINALPTGTEQGTYLSVDVGGSTLRIAVVELYGRASGVCPKIVASDTHPITAPIKALSGCCFFRWIATHIQALLKTAHRLDVHTPMGLSWSFPFAQLESVARGTILAMGKGYLVADEIAGQDLSDAFAASFRDLGLRISLTAIVNDTVASLLSHAYMNPRTRAAVILGTGVNASAYLHSSTLHNDGTTSMLVNTEMSLMGGDGVLPATKWDRYLDERVERPGFQPFETMVSGRYMGEVARLVICDLHARRDIFLFSSSSSTCLSSAMLTTPYAFETRLMAKIEGLYASKQGAAAKLVFERAAQVILSDAHFETVAQVLQAVSCRSANWIAASIMALVRNLGPLPSSSSSCSSSPTSTSSGVSPAQAVTIAYSGTVIEKYPGFKDRCQATLDYLGACSGSSGKEYALTLEPMVDGTLYGPAIASAMYV